MSLDPHYGVNDAGAVLDRVRGRVPKMGRRRPRRRTGGPLVRLAMIGAANLIILVATIVVGMAMPIGLFGALLVLALMVAVTLAIALAPAAKAPSQERLRAVELKTLPAQTERWLDAQRPLLPAPAMTLVDQIGVRLDALSPQLAELDDSTPAGAEIRKLVGEQLPAFVKDYTRVPAGLRTVARNGRTPDAQLLDGLALIDRQIGEMTAQLAQGDLDSLATRGRFLEIKYRGDGTE